MASKGWKLVHGVVAKYGLIFLGSRTKVSLSTLMGAQYSNVLRDRLAFGPELLGRAQKKSCDWTCGLKLVRACFEMLITEHSQTLIYEEGHNEA